MAASKQPASALCSAQHEPFLSPARAQMTVQVHQGMSVHVSVSTLTCLIVRVKQVVKICVHLEHCSRICPDSARSPSPRLNF